MKKFILLMFLVTIFFSCKKNEVTENTKVISDSLFSENANLIILYTDSIKLVEDTLKLQKLENNLDVQLTKLAYSYPPDCHLSLTEDQNDSLIKLTDNLISETKKAELRLSIRAEQDTINTEIEDKYQKK